MVYADCGLLTGSCSEGLRYVQQLFQPLLFPCFRQHFVWHDTTSDLTVINRAEFIPYYTKKASVIQ